MKHYSVTDVAKARNTSRTAALMLVKRNIKSAEMVGKTYVLTEEQFNWLIGAFRHETSY